MKSISFVNNEIFEINGYSKKTFSGNFTPDELAERLIDEWIPFYECHRCGKGDYCKYAISISPNSSKKEDIKCGVAKVSLRNFILRTIFVIEGKTKDSKQKYLDAAYHFYKFVIDSEQWNGIFISNRKLNWWGDDSIKFFGQIIPLRDTLNDLGNCLKEFDEIYIGSNVLFVEGETEKIFISSIRGDDEYFRFWPFKVESYGGKPNRKIKKVQLLIGDYKQKGYTIYAQGDRDGSEKDSFDNDWIEKKLCKKENIFQFKYDFETSIPRKLLYDTLKKNGYLENESFLDFNKKIPDNQSINTSLFKEFNINTNEKNLKLEIARSIGKELFNINKKGKDEFYNSELGQFVLFLEKIK